MNDIINAISQFMLQVSEEQLIGFLEQLSGSDADIAKSNKPKKVTIQRRKYDFDDDDDDDSDLM